MNIVACNEQGISQIIEAYEDGRIIAFPTDTVYGLGCNPLNKDSISRIYDIKRRSGRKRFPILGFSKKDLEKIVEFNSKAEKISEKFWPGQVTLLLPIRKEMTKQIENNGKLAVRVPNNECVLSILKQCKLIVGTSANISGEESILDSSECKTKLSKIAQSCGINSKTENSIEQALRNIANENESAIIFCTGSLYFAAEILNLN